MENGIMKREAVDANLAKVGLRIIEGEYTGKNVKMPMMDNDGYKYSLSYAYVTSSIKNRKSPPRKFHVNNPYTIDNIKHYMKLNNITHLELLSTEYYRNNKDLEFKCEHGHIFKRQWANFQQGITDCPKCKFRFSNLEEYKEYVKKICGDEYSVIGEYITSQDYIMMRHNKCGNEWLIAPNVFAGGNRCNNPDCYILRGEKSPHWKPELTEEDRKNNYSRLNTPGYKKWRGEVLGAYNNKCVICGRKTTKDNRLVPHHLNSWNSDIDGRYDVSNGVAICTEHHIEFHRQYKYGNNTKMQFVEYKKIKDKDKQESEIISLL